MKSVTIALVQSRVSSNIKSNVAKTVKMVEEAAKIQLLAMTLSRRELPNLEELKEKFKTEDTVE